MELNDTALGLFAIACFLFAWLLLVMRSAGRARAKRRELEHRLTELETRVSEIDGRLDQTHSTLTRIKAFQGPRSSAA